MPDGSDCATRFTVVAVDTNLLVYAYRADSPFHADARTLIDSLVEGAARWAIPWPCVHEFIAIVTHPRVFKTPTPVAIALSQIRDLASLPQVTFLAESDDYLSRLEAVALPAKSRGGTDRSLGGTTARSAPARSTPARSAPGVSPRSSPLPLRSATG